VLSSALPEHRHMNRNHQQRYLTVFLTLYGTYTLVSGKYGSASYNPLYITELESQYSFYCTTHTKHKVEVDLSTVITGCRFLERFASAWPELIIACYGRRNGSWPPLLLACAAYRLFAHELYAFQLQTDRQKDRHHNWLTYCVFRFTGSGCKKIRSPCPRW